MAHHKHRRTDRRVGRDGQGCESRAIYLHNRDIVRLDSEDEVKEGLTAMMGMTIPVNVPGQLIATAPQCRGWDQGNLALKLQKTCT